MFQEHGPLFLWRLLMRFDLAIPQMIQVLQHKLETDVKGGNVGTDEMRAPFVTSEDPRLPVT